AALFGNRPRCRDRVELVRVVQHCCLGGSRRTRVVVARDGVQELRRRAGGFEQAQPEVHVSEQRPLLGGTEYGRWPELARAPEVVPVTAKGRRDRRCVDLRRLQRAYFELEPVAEPLDPAEDAYRVTLGEAPVEQLDVVPDACIDAPGGIDELEREVRSAAAGS